MEVRTFLPEQPTGTMSLDNLWNNFLALYQGDLGFLRPRNDYIHDDFEYQNLSAMIPWDVDEGNVELSIDTTIRKFGNGSLKAVNNASGTSTIGRTSRLSNLTSFMYADFWVRSSAGSDTIQFVIVDSSGNASYWEFTITSADTWQNVTLDLSNPDGNYGTDADLSSVTTIYFSELQASTTYHFDHIRYICGNSIIVEGTEVSEEITGNYRRNIWLTKNAPVIKPTSVVSGFTLPASGVRKDLVVLRYYEPMYTFAIIQGTPTNYPAPEIGDIPICYVYLRSGQTRIVAFRDKDNYPYDGYIEADVRPFIQTDSDRFNITQGGVYPTEATIDGSELSSESWIDFFVRHSTGTSRRQIAQIGYSGLQLYVAGILTGARINEFSTDGTFSDNSNQAVPTEKATKTYIDSKRYCPQHHIDGFELVCDTTADLDVTPGIVQIGQNNEFYSSATKIDVNGITSAGNYFEGSPISGTGIVYVYVTPYGSTVRVKYSLNAPQYSDTFGNTAGTLIYRKIAGTPDVWYRCIGALRVTSNVIEQFRQQGAYFALDSFISISAGSTSDSHIPKISKLGNFWLEAYAGNGQYALTQLRPAGSTGDYFVAGWGSAVAHELRDTAVVACPTNDDQQVDYVANVSSGTSICNLIGWWINIR